LSGKRISIQEKRVKSIELIYSEERSEVAIYLKNQLDKSGTSPFLRYLHNLIVSLLGERGNLLKKKEEKQFLRKKSPLLFLFNLY
jgi:hypothetical protein